ncbi:carbohydrate ABC transporter permease [Oryzibacter oryziterrae]|uniref:carbohydrate ABC transporter permease n=1 Tax=Oryzibacter oryziterrae TaxID=2766474 RepID=UPI001F2033AF|nr:sugar ABC transporter permease [Oryzibacter oryziterrae]
MSSLASGPAQRRRFDINGWLFVAPALTLIAIFMIFPILQSFWMSFQQGRGMNMTFAGYGNLVKLWNDPLFIQALSNTFIFFLIQVPIMLTLALVMAAVLNNPAIRFRGLFRTAIFLPCVTSLVAYSVLFKSMFVTDGIVNSTLETIGLISDPIPWMTDPFWCRTMIIIAITWRWTGYNMIFYLAAMQNIDKSVYEAARIDGVPSIGRFAFLTVPMLKPVILFTTVTSTIGTLQLFDEVANITGGGSAGGAAGPSNSALTLSLYIYNLTFKFMPSFGYAALVSYVIVFLVAILAFIQFYLARESDR